MYYFHFSGGCECKFSEVCKRNELKKLKCVFVGMLNVWCLTFSRRMRQDLDDSFLYIIIYYLVCIGKY